MFPRRLFQIVAVGRNYADHAAELGNAVPENPILFLKPQSSVTKFPHVVQVPLSTPSLHHEVELAVKIKHTLCRPSSLEQARAAIGGYCVALDMTDRSAQNVAKKAGLPWTLAKSLDTFTPLGPEVCVDVVSDDGNLELWLTVNGKTVQRGSTKDMIFPVGVLLAYISHRITLNPGDVVLTGTPAGVGPVVPGDFLQCGITGLPQSNMVVQVIQGPNPPDAAQLLK